MDREEEHLGLGSSDTSSRVVKKAWQRSEKSVALK